MTGNPAITDRVLTSVVLSAAAHVEAMPAEERAPWSRGSRLRAEAGYNNEMRVQEETKAVL